MKYCINFYVVGDFSQRDCFIKFTIINMKLIIVLDLGVYFLIVSMDFKNVFIFLFFRSLNGEIP